MKEEEDRERGEREEEREEKEGRKEGKEEKKRQETCLELGCSSLVECSPSVCIACLNLDLNEG
jgi:hypothetical protein